MFIKTGIAAVTLMAVFVGASAFAEKTEQSEKSSVWTLEDARARRFKVIEFDSPTDKKQQCIAVMRPGVSGSPMACFDSPNAGVMFRDTLVSETVVYSSNDAELSVLAFTPQRANHMNCSFTSGFTENKHFIDNLQCMPK